MASIVTTGGVLSDLDILNVYECIADVFECNKTDIHDLTPLQKGITNAVFTFKYNGGKYVYRHPGVGSSVLVDRGRESMIQKEVEDAEIDNTLVAMSIKNGWRISKFIENRPFEYHNLNDMVRAVSLLKKLHHIKPKVRWEFDIKEKWEEIEKMTPIQFYGENFKDFPEFSNIKKHIYSLYELTKLDGIKKCLSHGDCRDENFLINDNDIYLIDWEYAGFGDPGFDLGTYIDGGEHSQDDIDKILYIYFGRRPTIKEKRHFYAYIAISGFFYMNWVMFKESQGQKIGYLKSLWYNYAKIYSEKALEMYNL